MPYASEQARSAYRRKVYQEKRAWAIEVLGGVCVECGSEDDLHIDHINPLEKTFRMSSAASVSWKRWKAEVAKCQLLCIGCHTRKTNGQSMHGCEPLSDEEYGKLLKS